jgi:glyceraldehyde-3-phosphate dehydrogenase (NADP+)
MATTLEATRATTDGSAPRHPIFLAGEWVESEESLAVTNPYDGSTVGVTFSASRAQLDRAIIAAEAAFTTTRQMPTYDRVNLLKAIAAGLQERRDEIARLIALEAGKPLREAEVEADRGVFTVDVAAEEARRIEGEVIPLDLLPSSKAVSASSAASRSGRSPASRPSTSP